MAPHVVKTAMHSQTKLLDITWSPGAVISNFISQTFPVSVSSLICDSLARVVMWIMSIVKIVT